LSWSPRRSAAAALLSATALVLMGLTAIPASAATINVNCSTQSLQAKISAAPAGSTLLIKGTCDGDFSVDRSLTLRGDPSATLDAQDAGTTLVVTGTPTVHLVDLVVTGGRAIGGGGIRKEAGTLTLLRVTVEDNLVSTSATGVFVLGGGILSSAGPLRLTDSRVVHNRSLSIAVGSGTAAAEGAGIEAANGPVTLTNSVVASNRVTASNAVGSAQAEGGGLLVRQGSLTMTSSHVDENNVTARSPSDGVEAFGGGIECCGSNFDLRISKSTVSRNGLTVFAGSSADLAVAQGGAIEGSFDAGVVSQSTLAGNRVQVTGVGLTSGTGGAMSAVAQTKLTVSSSRITGNGLTVSAGDLNNANGEGSGGGVLAHGPLAIVSSSVSSNSVTVHATGQSQGFAGGVGEGGGTSSQLSILRSTVDGNQLVVSADHLSAGAIGGGVLSIAPATVRSSTVSRNRIDVSAGQNQQAAGAGGGLELTTGGASSARSVVNSTVANNVVHAASSGAGSALAHGGGVLTAALQTNVVNTSVARNAVSAEASSTDVGGGGVAVSQGITTFAATILAQNTGSPAPNCHGSVSSGGHNLLGPTAGCTFAKKPSDKVNVANPMLGLLSDNGGPTWTMALLTGSPAIDAIPTAACAEPTDQRGVPRPQGPACDIGSFERKP
jgi:hypothetical protein